MRIKINAIRATAPLAHTPRIVSKTELKLAKSNGGNDELSIQLYGVPPVSYTHLDVYKRQV